MSQEPNPETVEAVSAAAGNGVTDEQVALVLAALEALEGGDPVGTKKVNEAGDIAVRVLRNGRPVWWVVPVSGDKPYRDAQPTLTVGWTEL